MPEFLKEEPWFYIKSDKKRISQLKNIYNEQKIVIVGNGPSLNKINFDLLKSVKTISFNSIFLKKEFKPFIYMVEDGAVARENYKTINKYKSEYRFFPKCYKSFLDYDENTYFFNMNRGMYEETSTNYNMPRFSGDFSKRGYCGQSVTIMSLQLAFFMGFKDIGLIGMDFNYVIPKDTIIDGHNYLSQGEDPNHFHSNYFGAGKTWHDPKLENVKKSYELAKIIFESDNRNIVNCTIGGKLEVFQRKSLENFLND